MFDLNRIIFIQGAHYDGPCGRVPLPRLLMPAPAVEADHLAPCDGPQNCCFCRCCVVCLVASSDPEDYVLAMAALMDVTFDRNNAEKMTLLLDLRPGQLTYL